MCGLIALLFAVRPTWPMSLKTVWMWALYILVTIASTCYGMSYNALCGIITSNAAGRTKLANARMVCSSLGTNFTNLIAATMILFFSGTNQTENTARGYFFAVLFSILIGLPFILWTAVKSKERVPLPKEQRENGKIPIALQFKCLFGNKYALACVVGQFVAGFHAYGRMSILVYYLTYYEGNFKLYSITGVIGLFTGICGSGLLAPVIYKIFRHKGRAVGVSFGLAGILVVPMFWLSAKGILFWIFYALSNAFGTAASGLRYSCDGDNADYAEYKYGIRVDGFLSSFVSMCMKAGGAVGPAVFLAVLDKLGYVANQAQNAAVMTALNFGMSFLPGILLLIIAFIFLKFYDMDEKKHKEIVQAIEQRHLMAENE